MAVLNAVRTIQFDLEHTFPAFASLVTDPDNLAKQLVTTPITSEDLGFPEADGSWFLFLQTGLHGKPHHMTDGRPAVRFGFACISATKGSFLVDVTMRVVSAGWEAGSSNIAVPIGCEKSVFCQKIPVADLLDHQQSFLKNDALILTANVKITDRIRSKSEKELVIDRLLWDHAKMLAESTCADFNLTTNDGLEYRVHRAVLITRSRVFAAMLTHDTTENVTGMCLVPDVDGQTMGALLKFIYYGTLDGVVEFADTLLSAADKYELLDLKEACLVRLKTKIRVENAARRIILSEMHGAPDLKAAVFAYLKRGNASAFVRAGGLKEVHAYNEGLMSETALSWAA